AIHRVRSEVVKQRTSKANQIRGLVGEYGFVAPQSLHALRAAIPRWLEDADNDLSDRFRRLLAGLAEDLRYLDARVKEYNNEATMLAKELPTARRLMTLQGVGPIVATAPSASLCAGDGFTRGRDFAVTLGLTPKHHGTGGKDRFLGMSKRGDAYLRTMLIHGARSAVRTANGKIDPLSCWINKLLGRRHSNIVVVALANKTARMAWALVRNDCDYDPQWSSNSVLAA
ncbi:MAG: IS110 family transposase, partial [Cyanobacteria bacterium P01_D01_bin.123]